MMEAISMAWTIDEFLSQLGVMMDRWGAALMTVLGLAMIIVGIFKICKGLMSDRAQTNWLMCIVLLFVGGLLAFNGWSKIQSVAQGGGQTLYEMGG